MKLSTMRVLHVATDAVLVSLGWLAAYGIRYALAEPIGRSINPPEGYLGALPIVVVAWIAACWWFGIYQSRRTQTAVDELSKLLRGAMLGLLVLAAVGFFFKELAFGRLVVLASAGMNLVFQGASRMFFHRLERNLRRSGSSDLRVLIVGTGVPAIRLLQKLQDHPEDGYRVVGLLDDALELPEKDVAGVPVLGHVDDLRAVAIRHGVEEIFVALPSLCHTRMLSLVLSLRGPRPHVPRRHEPVRGAHRGHAARPDRRPAARAARSASACTRSTSRASACSTSSARAWASCSCAPLLAWVALRLRRGGVSPWFVHERIGRDGRPFSMIKLRTLRGDVGAYEEAPRGPDDPRITPYGRWLRATSIDELPQLWNVLRGEMSIVGPRPEMPFIVDRYDEWQRRRLAVKPGITGLWQILGRKDLPMHENLQYDFYYIRNRSLALDASILLRTAGAVWSRRGAF